MERLQRLFSAFPNNWPGAGLLLVRLSAGAPLIVRGISEIYGASRSEPFVFSAAAVLTGAFLVVGLWTPFGGASEAFLELRIEISGTSHQGIHILLAALGASLVMVGPGAWSIDARLFGRRRIDIDVR